MKKFLLSVLAIFLSAFFFCLNAQSTWTELGGAPLNSTNGGVVQILPDNQGNIYICGNFNQYNQNILKWNGTSWSTVGDLSATGHGAPFYSVQSMAIDPSGNLYVNADYNGGPNNVAKWDGTNWTVLGNTSFNGAVLLVATDNQGNVYASGQFTDAGGKNYVAKWDHNINSWSELGIGTNALNPTNIPNGGATIETIVVDNSGNVYAAGHFRNNNGNGNFYVAKWDGTLWSELGGSGAQPLNANGDIQSLKIDNAGNVYASGGFTDAYNSGAVAKWDHTTNAWSFLGALNSNTNVPSFAFGANGVVYAPVYDYYNQYSHVALVAQYNPNNNTWTEVDGTSNFFSYTIQSLATDATSHLYAGGVFTDASGNKFVASITAPGGVLPLKLTSFTAGKNSDAVVCNWQTASEENVDYFAIQRGSDGKNFVTVGTVNASGNSNSPRNYSYTDVISKNQNSSRFYYRLQMVDKNSSSTFSKIIMVDWNLNKAIDVYPIPANNFLNVSLNSAIGENKFSVIDASGKTFLEKQNLQSGQTYQLNISQLSKGIYFLEIESAGNRFTQMFIKE